MGQEEERERRHTQRVDLRPVRGRPRAAHHARPGIYQVGLRFRQLLPLRDRSDPRQDWELRRLAERSFRSTDGPGDEALQTVKDETRRAVNLAAPEAP